MTRTTQPWRVAAMFLLVMALLTSARPAKGGATVLDDGNAFHPDDVTIEVGDDVYFYDDGSGPYLITIGTLQFFTPNDVVFNGPGSYSFYDDAGDFGTVNVIASVAPTVSITGPPADAVFMAPASFDFTAVASDGISDIEFYVGTNLVDDVFSTPYSTSISGLPAGAYELTVIAYDDSGGTATNSINITVQEPVPIELTGASMIGGQLVFNVTGLTPGETNVLQVSADLTQATNWHSISVSVPADTSVWFTNAIVPGAQFFRVLQLP